MKVAWDTSLEQGISRFFEGARGGLDDLRKARLTWLKQESPRFFEGARQGLDVLVEASAVLDRQLAREFSFFGSIAFFNSIPLKREDRLSYVLAYLLDPNKTHGQGDLFLGAFLSHLREKAEQSDMKCVSPISTGSHVRVYCEAPTTHIEAGKRRIDILISMWVDGERVGIAIENKPWEGSTDEERQIGDYARHLQSVYGERFMLIYLTPTGEGPSEESVGCNERKRLEEEGQLVNASIWDWLADDGWLNHAEGKTEAERVRWFVSDFRKNLKESLPPQEGTAEQAA